MGAFTANEGQQVKQIWETRIKKRKRRKILVKNKKTLTEAKAIVSNRKKRGNSYMYSVFYINVAVYLPLLDIV